MDIVLILRDNTRRKPHRKHEEEVPAVSAEQSFFGERVRAEYRIAERPDRSEEGNEKGVGVIYPEKVVFKNG